MGVSSDRTRLAFCLLILQLWTSTDCSLFRAASFGGAQNETFDDVVSLGLSVPTPPFRVSALRVWENDGVMSAFQASYLVYDTTHSGVISLGPRSVTGYSSTAEPTINLVLNAGDLIESASGYSASNSTPELMEFTTLQYIAFVIRRSNGSREEHSAGSLVGQLQSVVGPIVGFWGGVGDTFDQLGVYVDPTLWVDRPTRMLKHELHGRLLGPAGLYFDDVVDLGNPYVLRIRSLSIYVQGGTSVAGIEIMYEDPMGVIRVLDHGMILGGANLNIAVVLNEGDYISQLSVERGQETAEEPADPCIQSLLVSVYRANTSSVENFTIGDPSMFQYFYTPSPVVALHGVGNEQCLQRLGGYQLLPESEVQRTCMLPSVTAPVQLLSAPTRIGTHSVIHLGCEEGLTPIRGGTLVCREDGTWKGELPVCGNVCSPVDPPSNATFRAVPEVLSNGTVLTVDCQFGFLPTGSRSLTCFNGEWFGEPECVFACRTPITPDQGQWQNPLPWYLPGHILTFTCAEGFGPLESDNVTCQFDGGWSGGQPLCTMIMETIAEASLIPSITSWVLDLNVGVLILEVNNSEGLNVSTVNCSAIQVVRKAMDTNRSGIECSSTPLVSGTKVTIHLSFVDHYRLSIDSGIATNVSNTFLVIEQHHQLFNDAGSLLTIPPASPLQAVMVIPDTTGPMLLSFDLDLNTGLLTLRFSEPVTDYLALPSAITLQSASNGTGISYTLTGGGLQSHASTGILEVMINVEDLNAVKALLDLATSAANTFLSFSSNITTDYAFNEAKPITSSNAVPVSSLILDSTPPMLIGFCLDMNAGELMLTYDETIDASSFNSALIALQNSTITPSTLFNLTSGVVSSLNGPLLLVRLSTHDFNSLASERQLAVSLDTTYIQASDGVVTDTSGNPSGPVTGLQALMFIADTTRPLLLMFTLDLSLYELNLTFSEPVDVDTFDITSLTLQSGPRNMSTVHTSTLTGGTVRGIGSFTVVLSVMLNENDAAALQALPELATEHNNTYISFPSVLVADYSGNPVSAVLPEDPLQVSVIIETTAEASQPPSVTSWSLDLNVGVLTLEVNNSEGLNVSTVNCSAIQIVRKALDTNRSGIECSSTPLVSGTEVTVRLSFVDHYRLSIDSGIATNVSNTFLVIEHYNQLFNNAGSLLTIPPASPLQAVMVIPDTTRPMLLSFDLDLNTALLTLRFSEPVTDYLALPSAITLQSASNGTATSYTLTGGRLQSHASTGILEVMINVEDLNAVKALLDLATSAANTFLSFSSNITTDYAFNEAKPITSSNAVPVFSFIPDTTPPMLIGFCLDMNAGELMLTYDETIDASSFNSALIALQNSTITPSTLFNLTSGVVSSLSGPLLLVRLSTHDFNSLASERQLAVSLDTTYIQASDGVVTDTSGNPSGPVTGLQALMFIADTTRPLLLMFTLDLSLYELNLTFSEPVDVDTFDITSLTLQSGPRNMSTVHTSTLTGGTVRGIGSFTVVLSVMLNENDAAALQALPELATEHNNTYISFPSVLVADYSGNPVSAVLPEDPLQVSVIIETTAEASQPPSVTSWSLDLNVGVLTLEVNNSEGLNVSTVNCSAIQIVRKALDTNRSGIECSSTPLVSGTEVTVRLSFVDHYRLSIDSGIATNVSNTFLVIEHYNQLFNNAGSLLTIPPASPLQAVMVIPDTTRPMLLSFDLDLNTALLTLRFSEPVTDYLALPSAITLQSASNGTATSYTLTGGRLISHPSTATLEVIIRFEDLNAVKALLDLATSAGNTFLSFNSNITTDYAFNEAEPIASSNAVPVFSFIPDTTPPMLIGFSLDMNTGELMLTYDEAISESSFDPSAIILQTASNGTGISYTLTGGELLSNTSTASLNVMISTEDLNAIKAHFDLSTLIIFLSFAPNIITDYALNKALPITSSNGVPVSSFIPDTTPPTLISFSLDMDAAELLLTYSESVNASTFDPTQITLENRPVSPSISYTLTSGAVSALNYTVILVSLSQDDFFAITSENQLAVSLNTTYLEDDYFAFAYYYSPSSVTDTSGNPSSPVTGLQATALTADQTSPFLLMFTLDLSLYELNLTFSEPVDVDTFDITSLTLQSGPGTMSTAYTLTGGRVRETGLTIVLSLMLNESDVAALQALPELATKYNSTYISFPSVLVTDYSGNPVSAVLPEDPLQVSGCSASSWTPPLTIGESFSLPCQEVYNGFNPRASVTWTCNGDLSLIFGIWNCTFGESVTISELGFDEHIVSLDGLNETLPYLQSQAESTNAATLVSTRIGGSALSNMVTVTLVIENPPELPTIKHRYFPASNCYCPPSPSSNPISQRLCVAPDYITTPCQCLSNVCECNTNGVFIDYYSRCTTDTDGDGTPNAFDDCEGCCMYEISDGFLWPNTSHGAEARQSCSLLHPSFMPSSMATRRCSQEGRWEAVNTLDCTFQKAGISLVVVQVVQRYGGTISEVQIEVNQTLSDAGHVPKALFVSAINLQVYNTIIVIVAELDVTTDTSVFAALLHNVERRSVYRQATGHQHSVARRASAAGIVNATTGYVANTSCPCPLMYSQRTFNVRCSGPPGPSCVCTNMTCKCADPYAAVAGGTSGTLECSVDTDGDGIPDIEDSCPEVYSPDGEEQCTSLQNADCPSETDTTWGVTWSATQFGKVDVQRCPGGLDETMGLARRECNSSSGGWEEPDLSECESLAFRNVRTEASNLLQSFLTDPRYNETNGHQPVPVQPTDVQVIVETTSYLVNSTNTANARVPLFPKDLNTTNNFLDVISLFANSTDLFATEQYAEEEALQIASNILSPNYTTQWNTLNEHPHSGGAPLLLHSVENIAVSVAANLASNRMTNVSQDGSMEAVFKAEHLAIQVAQLQPGPSSSGDNLTYKNVLYPRDEDAVSAVASSLDIPNSMVPQMVIPGALLEERANANMAVPVVNVIFNNLERILPNIYSNGSSIGSLRPGSLLILGQVSRFQASSNTLQATPIHITFPVPNQSQRTLTALQCVYWDFTSETADSAENLSSSVQLGGWSSQGLRLTGSWQEGSSHVVCESTHLTSFAMLVDYSGLVAEEEKELFSILTYVGCGISILCLLASIIFFISLKRELYTNVVHFVHINFCIALLCGLVFFLTIAPVGMTQSEGACTTVTVLVHYFFLAAFSWMLCEGLMMYILLVRVFGAHKKKWLIVYTLIGWGLPLPFVSITFVVALASNWDYYIVTSSNVWYCWLAHDNGIVWAFIAPMFLSIIVNCGFAILAIRGVFKFKKEQLVRTSAQKRNQKLVVYCLKAILIVLPLMGFTWLFGTLAAFNYSEVVRDIFSGLFIVCNTFQGVAIFVLHVVRHEKNWGKLKRLFTSRIGKKRQDTRSTQKSGTLSTSQGRPMEYAGLQSQTENATNTLRSLPSDDDNDNLPLVLQREESLQVKEEWSLFVINDQHEVNSKL